jgi:hypothetical protein
MGSQAAQGLRAREELEASCAEPVAVCFRSPAVIGTTGPTVTGRFVVAR